MRGGKDLFLLYSLQKNFPQTSIDRIRRIRYNDTYCEDGEKDARLRAKRSGGRCEPEARRRVSLAPELPA